MPSSPPRTRKLSIDEALAAAGLATDYAKRQVVPLAKPPAPDSELAKPHVLENGDGIRTLAGAAIQVPAQVRYRDKTEAETKAGVMVRIPQIMRQYFGYDPQPWMVADLCAMLGLGKEGMERNGYTAEQIEMSWMPDDIYSAGRIGMLRSHLHGKTSRGMFVYPILSLANDPNMAHILVGTNDGAGKAQLKRIDRFLTTNKDFTRDYPWCAKPPRTSGMTWSADELWVAGREDFINDNPSVFATGRGDSSLRTRRGKTVFDDLEGLGTVTEVAREDVWGWLTTESWRCMEDTGTTNRPLWLVQGTPFDVDSIYYRLDERAGITVSTLAYRYPADHPRLAGKLVWPARHEKVADMRRSDPRIFAFAMELDPRGGDTEQMGLEDVKRLSAARQAKRAFGFKIYVALDPAGGSKRRGADYAGIAVGRIKWGTVELPARLPDTTVTHWTDTAEAIPERTRLEDLPDMECLYAEAHRGGIYEQVHRAAFLAQHYNAPVIVEGNSQQKYHYGEVFAQTHPEVKVIDFMSTQEKKRDNRLGLSVLRTMLRQGRLKIVEELGFETDPGMQVLRRELRDLDVAKHLHICSAFWFIIRHVYEGPHGAPERITVTGPRPRAVDGFGGHHLGTVIDIGAMRQGYG